MARDKQALDVFLNDLGLYAHVPESADRQVAESLDRHYRGQPPEEERRCGPGHLDRAT